jgi:long-chain acyl-CoA synthetase
MAHADAEGFIFIVDSLKDMIITGGLNVYSREVEEALYKHAAVKEAAVIGEPHPQWGEQVTAVVVVQEGERVTEDEINSTLEDCLAGYKRPKRVVFVDDMPRTVTGKVMKHELRKFLKQ